MPIMDYKIPARYATSSTDVVYDSRNPRRFVKTNVSSVPTERKSWCTHQVLKLFLNLFTFNNRVVPAWQHEHD